MEKIPKYIIWEDINSNELSLFIRDLSEKIDINFKYLVNNVFEKPNNKKITKKKKDIIIEKQNEKRYSENIKKILKN